MLIIYDRRLPRGYLRKLRECFADAVLHPLELTSLPSVYDSIRYHTDIYLSLIGEDLIVHAPIVSEKTLDVIRNNTSVDLVKGSSDPYGTYPTTCCYNTLTINNTLFHNTNYTDKVIINETLRRGYEIVHVEQGYANCSAMVLNSGAAVTMDKGMAEAIRRSGNDVLIEQIYDIGLPGERYGFVGGASSNIVNRDVLVLGDLGMHEYGENIRQFSTYHGTDIIQLDGLRLFDAGGVIIL